MKIEARHDQNVKILEPKGKITIGVGAVALREAIDKALDADARKILIDFGEVTAMDLSSTGELVDAYTTVTNKGGKLMVCKLNSKVFDRPKLTLLFSVFEIYGNVQEAIDSF